MNRVLRHPESLEDRSLAALRPVDAATGVALDAALRVRALDGQASFVRNRRGLLVLRRWSGLAAHADAFDAPPATPATGSQRLRVAVDDPAGRYLPRLATLDLPRDADPGNAALAGSLFAPIDIPMFPAAHAATGANWSLLRVSLRDDAGHALGGALLRVLHDGEVIARGLTDGRGEALVAVIGVPVMSFGETDEDTVIVSTIAVTLQAVFDAATGTRTPLAALAAGAAAPVPLVDPFDLETRLDQLSTRTQALQIAARRSLGVAMTLESP